MRRAVRAGADGIAVSIIDPVAFNSLTDAALEKGIPVVSYNADGGRDNRRQAYIGQDLYQSGLKFGSRIVELVGEGDVLLYIATPGQLNIQPRVDGALDAVRDSGRPIRMHVVATGADVAAERKKVEQTYRALRGVRGMFAVDGGSTQAVAEVMRAYGLHRKGVRAGGYDLLPGTLESIAAGRLDFSIDQQPYLQGLLPIQQLFLFRYSGGLVSPADTNTGLKFVTRHNVRPYLHDQQPLRGKFRAAEVSRHLVIDPRPVSSRARTRSARRAARTTSQGSPRWAVSRPASASGPSARWSRASCPSATSRSSRTRRRPRRCTARSTGLGDLIDDYEFHYPAELSPDNLDEVRSALDGHGIYTVCAGLHLDPRFGRGGLVNPDPRRAPRRCASRSRAPTSPARWARTSCSGPASRATTIRSRRPMPRAGAGSSRLSARPRRSAPSTARAVPRAQEQRARDEDPDAQHRHDAARHPHAARPGHRRTSRSTWTGST